MDDSLSISLSISKGSVNEEMSMIRASMDEAASRLAEEVKPEAISNEKIKKGDEILETYRVVSDAIHGGMGSVWRVYHRNWDIDLAMKRPQPRFFAEGSEERKAQFIGECENWINLGLHPNIVACYYVREIGGVPTIFSEWMDGGSLKDRIADGTLYEGGEDQVQKRILDIAIQAAHGLAYSHENGLIHQDMKPGNLLLSQDWEAKVADFGLAKAREQFDGSAGSERSSGYTLAYCPAEQKDRDEAQRWMDIYAWALTVLEMYAGRRLWESGEEAKAHFDEYISKCRIGIPEKLTALLRSCLTDKPDSFSEISAGLTSLYGELFAEEYQRFLPDADLMSADNNNNYALSMLELGNASAAEKMWEQSLKVQPDHVQSKVNKTFYDLLNHRISYDQAYEAFEKIPFEEERKDALCLLRLEGSGLNPLYEIPNKDDHITADHNTHSIREEIAEMFSLPVHFDGKGSYYLFDQGKLHRYSCDESAGNGTEAAECAFVIDDADAEKLYAVTDVMDEEDSVTFTRTEIGASDKKETVTLTPDPDLFVSFMKDFREDRQYDRKYYVSHARSNIYLRKDPLESVIKALWYEDRGSVLCVMRQRDLMENFDPAEADIATGFVVEYYQMEAPYGTSGKMIRQSAVSGIPSFNAAAHLTKNNPFFSVVPGKWISRGQKKPVQLIDRTQENSTSRMYVGIIGVSPAEPLCAAAVYTANERFYRVFICRMIDSKFRHIYALSRFGLIDRVLQLNTEANRLEKLFYESVSQEDYQRAAGLFRQYREIESKADADKTVEMERVLARVCRRISIHHLSVEDVSSFQPAKEFFKKVSYLYDKDFSRRRKTIKKAKSNSDTEAVKAYLYAMKHLRVRKEDKDWLKSHLDYCNLWLSFLRPNSEFGYIAEPYIGSKGPALRLNIKDKSLVILQKERENKNLAGEWNPEDTWVVKRFVDPKNAVLSPDGRFQIKHSFSDMLYKIEGGRTIMLGSLILKSDKEAVFSQDGFYLRADASDGSTYCRISYNYEFPGFSDWDEDADFYAQVFISDHPEWTEKDFEGFMTELSEIGMGWLRRDSVRKKLVTLSTQSPSLRSR